MFTDIVKSSVLWSKYPNKMNTALKTHEKLIYKLVKKYGGIIIKTIGDAVMVFFKNDFKNGILCALEIQYELTVNPIYLSKEENIFIELRIGLCYGPANMHNVVYQGITLKDYFGNSVNTASRMESKVSQKGSVAVCFIEKQDEGFSFLNNISNQYDLTIKVKNYSHKCDKKRSERLLNYECLDPEILHGVNEIEAYLLILN